MTVMRHAVASQHSLSALQAERPASSSTSACAILSELESHLSEAGVRAARWRGISDTPLRGSAFGARSTPEWVHVSLLRREVAELEHDAVHGVAARLTSESSGLRNELSSLRARSDRTVGGLQEQLAQQTHDCWKAKEDLVGVERSLRAKEDECTRVSTALATESGRCAALERQNAELRMERDDARAASTTEATRRHEVEAQLRESERELRSTRERAEVDAFSAAQTLERQHASAAEAADAAAAERAGAQADQRRLEDAVAQAQMALASEAAERGAAERTHEQRETVLDREAEGARAGMEREAAMRRESEATLVGVREALAAATNTSRDAAARATTAEERREAAHREVEEARAALTQSRAAQARLEDAVREARADAKSARADAATASEESRGLLAQLKAAESAKQEALSSVGERRVAIAKAEASLRSEEEAAAAAAVAATEQRAVLKREMASLRAECDAAIAARNEAERAAHAAERQTRQEVASKDARSARDQRNAAIASHRREHAAKAEARRLRAALWEAEGSLQSLWSASFSDGGRCDELMMLLPPEEASAAQLAIDGPSSWLSLAPVPFTSNSASPFASPATSQKRWATQPEGKRWAHPEGGAVSDALAAARRVAEAHRQQDEQVGDIRLTALQLTRPDEKQLVAEAAAVAAAAAASFRTTMQAVGEGDGDSMGAALEYGAELDYDDAAEASRDWAHASALDTMRAVWQARSHVLSVATGHSAVAARRSAELEVLGEEMLDVELRAKASRVRNNSVQRRSRNLVRALYTWKGAAVTRALRRAAQAAAVERAETARWAASVLSDATAALEDVSSSVSEQVEHARAADAIHVVLSAQAHTLHLATASLAVEAEVHAAAQANKMVTHAEDQLAAAHAEVQRAMDCCKELETQLCAKEGELQSALEEAREATAAVDRQREEEDARAAAAATAAAEELAKVSDEAHRLADDVSAAQLCTVTAEVEKEVLERTLHDTVTNLESRIDAERVAVEREVATRREVEATLLDVREALATAKQSCQDETSRATEAEERCERLEREMDESREALREASLREGQTEEALRTANDELASAKEESASLDAETEAMRVTTSAIVGARESAIERELQLDEGVAELSSALSTAREETDVAVARATELTSYVEDLEQMVLAEANTVRAIRREHSQFERVVCTPRIH